MEIPKLPNKDEFLKLNDVKKINILYDVVNHNSNEISKFRKIVEKIGAIKDKIPTDIIKNKIGELFNKGNTMKSKREKRAEE